MNIRHALVACILSASLGTSHAQEVTQTHQGLSLNANLELANNKTLAEGVILITHGGLAHNDMEFIRYLQTLLKARGYSSLAINLSLGLDNRHGMYDCNITHRHRNSDAVDEMGLWMNWLQTQGAQRITLLGHSRGGAQTALYAAEHNDPRVQALILLAPAIAENTSPETYQRIHQKPLKPLLQTAQARVRAKNGGTVLKSVGLLNCSDTSATADSFVSYYNQDPRLDTPYLIPRIRLPILVLVAGSDAVVVKLENKLARLTNSPNMKMKIIEGADHTFRDLASDDAADAIDDFLKTATHSANRNP